MAATAEQRATRRSSKTTGMGAGVAFLPAAITAALRHLLENNLVSLGVVEGIGSDVQISALPPDRVKAGEDERVQLNLFLYEIRPRGLGMVSRHAPEADAAYRPGSAVPVLELSYLLSAYGPQDMQIELLLGGVMEVLCRHPVLSRDDLSAVFATLAASNDGGRSVLPAIANLSESGTAQRVEFVRLSHFFLETEEAMQLWSALQAKLRPSLLYRAAIHLATTDMGEGGEAHE